MFEADKVLSELIETLIEKGLSEQLKKLKNSLMPPYLTEETMHPADRANYQKITNYLSLN